MIKAVDARTMITTSNGFMLGDALLLLLVHAELVLVSALTNLSTSRETKKKRSSY